MRIAVDARPLASPLTGIGRYTHELTKRLIETDHNWFLYSDRPLQVALPNNENTTVRSGNASGGSPGSLRWAQWEFVRWAKEDQIDIFWSPRHHLPLLLPSRIKTVVTVHDLVWKRFPDTMQRKNYWLEKLLMRPSIHKADKLIAVSEFTASELSCFYPEASLKTQVIYEAASDWNSDGELPAGVPDDYLLFVGTLEPRKNLERLLEAYAQIKNPSLPLVIAGGSGWGNVQLDAIIRKLNLGQSVLRLGYVNEESLGALYANANALVMPSIYEGFGLPVIEAISHGVPCIVSQGTALEEIAGKTAVLVNPFSKSELSEAIINISQPDLNSQLASHTRAQSLEFSWDKATTETLALMTD